MQKPEIASKTGAALHVVVFEYPAGGEAPRTPTWEIWEPAAEKAEAAVEREPAADAAQAAAEAALRAEFDRKLAEETRKAFDAGLERGRQEGQHAEREAQGAAIKMAQEQRMRQSAELMAKFAVERDKYMQAVEHEVVNLALAVAARILRREAQMDPLLLTGAVRVALGQLSGSTAVRLFVPPDELSLWTETMALIPNLAVKPTVLAGEGMRLGDCRIETELGSVDLGIRAQLAEIERGFFDRTGARKAEPGAAGSGAAQRPGPGSPA